MTVSTAVSNRQTALGLNVRSVWTKQSKIDISIVDHLILIAVFTGAVRPINSENEYMPARTCYRFYTIFGNRRVMGLKTMAHYRRQ